MKHVILTLIGPDSVGIVSRLAFFVEKHGGNWLDSRMMRLEGTFSGILSINLPQDALGPFGKEVETFMSEHGFEHDIQPANSSSDEAEGAEARLSLSGHDHPGIIHGIFTVFQKNGVNVEELSSGLRTEPWSGTPIFEAQARLRLPDSLDIDVLQSGLENLAADLMVELELRQD